MIYGVLDVQQKSQVIDKDSFDMLEISEILLTVLKWKWKFTAPAINNRTVLNASEAVHTAAQVKRSYQRKG